ncbi:kelch repeat-containing protein [Streptomyces sp. NPDC058755]|uniref:kelch repeat-containing protein n=1 Tax=Streptomyces sp. NPDC058755 TaxID=3346624 RepID=UPI0036B1B4D8
MRARSTGEDFVDACGCRALGATRSDAVAARCPADALLALTATLAQAQSAWVAVPHMPTARNGLGGTSAPCPKGEGFRGTCVYAIGGQNANSPALGTVEAYSPATNTWRSLPQLPTPRYAVTATTAPCPQAVRGLAGTCGYAIGGFTGTQWPDPAHDVGTVEAYSPATNTWRTPPQLPTTRSFAAATTAPCPPAVAGLRGSCVYRRRRPQRHAGGVQPGHQRVAFAPLPPDPPRRSRCGDRALSPGRRGLARCMRVRRGRLQPH